jgi:5-methylcytosine-specific restriction protein A
LILTRLEATGTKIAGAWIGSKLDQGLPNAERSVFDGRDSEKPPSEQLDVMTQRLAQIGRSPGSRKQGGNSSKRLRIRLLPPDPTRNVANLIGARTASEKGRTNERLPAEELNRVTAENIRKAVELLSNGFTEHEFGESTDFDLLSDDGIRLPPKAVFGVAATEALGYTVLPKHFTAGRTSPCFRLLKNAGFRIVVKNTTSDELPRDQEKALVNDLEWREGDLTLRTHLQRERKPAASHAKREEFRRTHGRLFCERCGLDPVELFGAVEGEACIEVHHETVHVKDMTNLHSTTLDDLKCLCANCHRFVHKMIRPKSD